MLIRELTNITQVHKIYASFWDEKFTFLSNDPQVIHHPFQYGGACHSGHLGKAAPEMNCRKLEFTKG
ncbi:hypothetical protein ACTXT7_010807 [Hymenolepis weldensis]